MIQKKNKRIYADYIVIVSIMVLKYIHVKCLEEEKITISFTGNRPLKTLRFTAVD